MLLNITFPTDQSMKALKFVANNADFHGLDLLSVQEGKETSTMMLNSSRSFIIDVLKITKTERFGMDTVWLYTLDS